MKTFEELFSDAIVQYAQYAILSDLTGIRVDMKDLAEEYDGIMEALTVASFDVIDEALRSRD